MEFVVVMRLWGLVIVNIINIKIHFWDVCLWGFRLLYYINWISRTTEFGIYIGDMDYREGGYGSETLRTLIGYGFNDLNMKYIYI